MTRIEDSLYWYNKLESSILMSLIKFMLTDVEGNAAVIVMPPLPLQQCWREMGGKGGDVFMSICIMVKSHEY